MPLKRTKFLFVTGGVVSGLGKGVSAAALGRLLKARNYRVFVQKFDPYYNVDPGTMSPYQHGEVFVTVDGGETDLDLGHYERFIGETFTKDSNYTQGKLMQELLEEERLGVYHGKTIQAIPHVTDKIIHKIEQVALSSKADFIITEVGGTVGDIESQPFLQALWEFSHRYQGQTFLIHCSFIPYLKASEEFKTKPTQHSVRELHASGLSPNMILLRANSAIPASIAEKTAALTFVKRDHCVPVPDVDNIYKLPLYFEKLNLAKFILQHFGLPCPRPDLADWKKYVKLINAPKHKKVRIAMVGKYVELEDAYKSIVEAINISANYAHCEVELVWLASSSLLDEKTIAQRLEGVSGVIILPGFGKRGFIGKVAVARFTRLRKLPTLGICYGFQAMVIVQAQELQIPNPTSREISRQGTFVIDLIQDKKHHRLGGTLRLGRSKTKLVRGSRVSQIYGSTHAYERHRHRYEASPQYVEQLNQGDFLFSGFDEQTGLAEVCEVKSHPFYIGVQAHPEFEANPLHPHPLFQEFLRVISKSKP
ncbi:CTP synthase [Mycoplasma sp. ATU-Cv-508]|uniref:CTP synthase n=1 Tax=Mycoplasma sp. ATU-Cv-508 TaxID=2048001 RepID=UPI000FDD81FC